MCVGMCTRLCRRIAAVQRSVYNVHEYAFAAVQRSVYNVHEYAFLNCVVFIECSEVYNIKYIFLNISIRVTDSMLLCYHLSSACHCVISIYSMYIRDCDVIGLYNISILDSAVVSLY